MPNVTSAQQTKKQLYSLDHISGVIGTIDGMHIPIIDPSGNSIAISKASICTAVHFGYRPSLAVSSSTGILHAISPPN